MTLAASRQAEQPAAAAHPVCGPCVVSSALLVVKTVALPTWSAALQPIRCPSMRCHLHASEKAPTGLSIASQAAAQQSARPARSCNQTRRRRAHRQVWQLAQALTIALLPSSSGSEACRHMRALGRRRSQPAWPQPALIYRRRRCSSHQAHGEKSLAACARRKASVHRVRRMRTSAVGSTQPSSHTRRVLLSGMHAGMRAAGKKADLALIVADQPAAAAGVFTQNVICAAPVTYCKHVLGKSDTARAVSSHTAHRACQALLLWSSAGVV